MNKLPLTFLLYLITGSLFSQDDAYHYYRITADNVNVRKDTGLNSKVMMKSSFGQEFTCLKFDSAWYQCQTDLDYNDYFISSKYIATDDQFILECERKNRKDLSALLILEQLYNHKGDYEKAVNTSIEITNLYRNNPHPTKEESCALFRELPIYSVVPGGQNTLKYKTSIISDYCNEVIKVSKDSFLIAWALLTLSRCNGENGTPLLAMELLLKVINDYGMYLIAPLWCHNHEYRPVAFMGVVYHIIYFAQNAKVQKEGDDLGYNFLISLNKICADPKSNVAAKAIACNLIPTYQW